MQEKIEDDVYMLLIHNYGLNMHDDSIEFVWTKYMFLISIVPAVRTDKLRAQIWERIAKPDPDKVQKVMADLGAPEIIAGILCQRGLDDSESIRKFFGPKIQDLEDPFLMKDMEKATERIERAVESKENVMIYGDYDVDGTTSVALCFQFFRNRFQHCEYYIPDRYDEGYGISKKGIDYAKEQGISLIIALDCGIRSVDLVSYANGLGIDFIICDHHLPGEQIPEAIAVLDPKQTDCEYPYKELCGCGIGFKLIQAFAIKNEIPDMEYLQFLDLVCLAIASDIVPITGENRVLAHFGLKLINSNPSLGIRKLIDKSIQKEVLSIGDLVFYLGPRINAAGRMDKAHSAVDLLTTDEQSRAESLAVELNKQNAIRRTEDEKITAELRERVSANPELLQRRTLVFYDPSWHKGVIGIAASRAVEMFYKPTIILTGDRETISGSGRSIKGFDLHEALQSCSEHLIQFGGHTYAAGMTMHREQLEDFSDAFEAIALSSINAEDLLPRMRYDAEIEPEDIDEALLNIIMRMAPFGPGNLNPVFFGSDLRDDGSGRIIGSTAEHIRLNIVSATGSIPAIGFGMADQFETIKKTGSFEACFQIQENIFRGIRNLQLNLKALRPTSGTGSIVSEKD